MTPPLLAVIVLYGMPAEQSPAYVSFRQEIAAQGLELPVILWDNSPTEQPAPAGFAGQYLRDTTNPGLAVAYNHALAEAQSRGIPWLLLLDQDTTVTAAFLQELLAAMEQAQPPVVAICPRLIADGKVCSPMPPPRFGPPSPVPDSLAGIAPMHLHPYNSGAAIRVSAMAELGGFPLDFPLDYLDHATFERLQSRGGKVYLLRATLQHALSSAEEHRQDKPYLRRRTQILQAERRFYRAFGTPAARFLRRVRLLRAAAGRILRRQERGQTWRMLKAALLP